MSTCISIIWNCFVCTITWTFPSKYTCIHFLAFSRDDMCLMYLQIHLLAIAPKTVPAALGTIAETAFLHVAGCQQCVRQGSLPTTAVRHPSDFVPAWRQYAVKTWEWLCRIYVCCKCSLVCLMNGTCLLLKMTCFQREQNYMCVEFCPRLCARILQCSCGV